MARLSDADQGGLPVPRFDSCGADRARPGALPRSRAAHARATPPRYSGMAEFLLQVADDRAGAVSGARSVHSAHEAEEHSAALEGRRVDYTFGAGVLRLVACRSEFVTADAAGGVRVLPLDGPSIGGVGVDIAAELAS